VTNASGGASPAALVRPSDRQREESVSFLDGPLRGLKDRAKRILSGRRRDPNRLGTWDSTVVEVPRRLGSAVKRHQGLTPSRH